MANLPQPPSQFSPAGEPTIFRQQRAWANQLQTVVAQHEAAFQGRYLPQGTLPPLPTARPPPHLAAKYDGTTVMVGIGRNYAAPIPEFVFVNYRGSLIEIAKTTADMVTITAAGYVVYEVTCVASVWAATAVFSTTLTALADTSKIYIPIAKVLWAGGAVTGLYQILADNPVIEVGSPQYSIAVDTTTGRLQFLNDSQVPPPMSIYATNQDGIKGWWPLCALKAACDGEDPEDGQPCGVCSAESCYKIASFAADMFDPIDCYAEGILNVSGTPWDGYMDQTSSAGQPCAYTGSMILTDPNDSAEYLATYSLVQYLDGATCTWQLTILAAGFAVPAIIWQGTHTNAAPDGAAFAWVAGCDTTATVSIEYCYAVSCGTLDADGYRISGYNGADFGCGTCPQDATTEPDWDGTWPDTLSPTCGFANAGFATANILQIDGSIIYTSAIYMESDYDGAGHNRWFFYATCDNGADQMWSYYKYEGDTPAGEYTRDDFRGHNPGFPDPSCGGPATVTVEAIP